MFADAPTDHLNKPGTCPICGMDLVPVKENRGRSRWLNNTYNDILKIKTSKPNGFG